MECCMPSPYICTRYPWCSLHLHSNQCPPFSLQSIIYRLVRWPRVHDMLSSLELQQALHEQSDPAYCDKDPLFDEARNSDFSHRHNGILKERFATVFHPFLEICVEREGLEVGWGGEGRGRGRGTTLLTSPIYIQGEVCDCLPAFPEVCVKAWRWGRWRRGRGGEGGEGGGEGDYITHVSHI